MGAQKAPEALSTVGINPLVDSRRATLEEVIRACYISYPHGVRNLPTYFDAEASNTLNLPGTLTTLVLWVLPTI